MEGTGAYASAGWHANDHIGVLSPTIMDLGQVVYDLIESDRNKIGELHLHHALVSFER